jgi:hypothetical protein
MGKMRKSMEKASFEATKKVLGCKKAIHNR